MNVEHTLRLPEWFLMGHRWQEARVLQGKVLVPIVASRKELAEKLKAA